MISASSSAECSNLVVVMPVIVVPPVEKIHSGRLALSRCVIMISMKVPHCSRNQLRLGSRPSLKIKGTSQSSKLCMSPPVPP